MILKNKFLNYDSERGRFYLNREPRNGSEFFELAHSIKHLEKDSSVPNNFNQTIIRDMEISHYARCLLFYVKQVLNDGLQHKDTCYARYASNYVPLGFLGELDIEQFFKKKQPIFGCSWRFV